MPLDITIGDLTWRWQLRDDRATVDWLSRRPWLGDGGVVVVQAPDDGDETIRALQREIYGADCSVSDVRFVPLSLIEGSFNAVIGEWLGIKTRKMRDLALALADDLLARPAIFLLDARRFPLRSTWADEASAVWDMASKLEVEKKPSIIVVHRRGEAPLRGRYILDRGWPVGLAHSLLDDGDDRLWSKYMHLRFAWESGGVIDDAMDCAAIAGELAPDDNELERVLNCFAVSKFLRLTEQERIRWAQYVDAPSDLAPTVCGYMEELDGQLTAFPWLARALLLQVATQGGTSRALRHEVLCRPIAEQVLKRCFAVEASLRRRLPQVLPQPPEEVRERWERFRANGATGRNLEAELYPLAHPYPPTDAWDFASVGQVAMHAKVPREETARLHRVRILRNAVAHGHYMGWRAVTEARALRGLLG